MEKLRKFKQYPDITEVRAEEGKPCLFVAIDSVSMLNSATKLIAAGSLIKTYFSLLTMVTHHKHAATHIFDHVCKHLA